MAVVTRTLTVEFTEAGGEALSGVIVFDSDVDGDKDIYTMDLATGAITQLTTTAAYDGMPAWCPDGQKIVFVSARDGDTEIFIMDSDGTDQTQITFNTTQDRRPSCGRGRSLSGRVMPQATGTSTSVGRKPRSPR